MRATWFMFSNRDKNKVWWNEIYKRAFMDQAPNIIIIIEKWKKVYSLFNNDDRFVWQISKKKVR